MEHQLRSSNWFLLQKVGYHFHSLDSTLFIIVDASYNLCARICTKYPKKQALRMYYDLRDALQMLIENYWKL